MKLIFVFVCIALCSKGQEFPSIILPMEGGKVTYREVINSGNNTSANYDLVYAWVAGHMVENKYQIIFNDKELGRIIFKGVYIVTTYTTEAHCTDTAIIFTTNNLMYDYWIDDATYKPKSVTYEIIYNKPYTDAWAKLLRINLGAIGGKKAVEATKEAINVTLTDADRYFKELPYEITGNSRKKF